MTTTFATSVLPVRANRERTVDQSETRPTVCQLLHSLSVGGAEILAARIAHRLRDSVRFVFACLDDRGALAENLERDGFPVHCLGRRPGFDWGCALRLSRLLREEKVDIVHAHQYGPFFYAMTSRLRGPRKPILFTEHGRHQPDYPRRKRMIANRLLLSRRDRCVAVGEAVRTALINNEGLPGGRVEVIYNGVDTGSYAAETDRAEARRLMKAEPGEFVIIQVARFDYLKDHSTALRALSRVLAAVPQARLVLVGDGPERERIKSQVRESGLDSQVRLLGTRGDVKRLLPGADLFLLTSTSEGIPLTVIEAMAAGLPVVATDVGGVGEVVMDGATGLLAPAKDDAALATAIGRLVNDSELRNRFGRAGQERARERFDETGMCRHYQQIYISLVAV